MVDFTASNGLTIKVPATLNYSTVDNCLAQCKKHGLQMRGHVLVWHSQTPEWFFHENWDKQEPYVTKAEMTKRQEWYIKEVLEHFTTKYENLFYGWDVLNEAISDATGDYRTEHENGENLLNDTHGSNSSWWMVYQSNEYVINAFRFANKYAPEYVELYYNDYNSIGSSEVYAFLKIDTENDTLAIIENPF